MRPTDFFQGPPRPPPNATVPGTLLPPDAVLLTDSFARLPCAASPASATALGS